MKAMKVTKMKKKHAGILRCAGICTVTAMAILLMGAALLPTFAAASVDGADNGKYKYGSMLLLGDSISTGYGLQNYTPGGNPYLCQSYGNLLAASLGLSGGESYINRAVNGDASDDLLALLPSLTENIKASELIIISIGGNDLLHILPQFASTITGKSVTGLEAAAGAIMAMDPATLAQKLSDPVSLAPILGAISAYSKNLPLIIEGVHAANPTARVIFLAQYDPMAGSFASPAFGQFAGNAIDSLNLALRTAVAASGYGYEVADIPSVINVNAEGYTNISDADIHPNAEGHALMAKYLGTLVANAPQPVEVTPGTDTESGTEVPVETEVVPTETAAGADAGDETTDGICGMPDATEVDTKDEATGDASSNGCGSTIATACVTVSALCAVALTIKGGGDEDKKKR